MSDDLPPQAGDIVEHNQWYLTTADHKVSIF